MANMDFLDAPPRVSSPINEGPLIVGLLTFFMVFGGIFVFARVFCRMVIKPQFGWDDAFIVIAWVTALGFDVSMYIAVSEGFGRPSNALTLRQLMRSVEAEYIGEVFVLAAYPPGKASVAYLLMRIFPSKKLKWSLWALVALNAGFFYSSMLLDLLQCTPVAYAWDRTIPGGSCLDPSIFTNHGIATGAIGAVSDIILALVPWFYIRKLNIGLKEKTFIGIALSLGVFAGVCSCVKTYYVSILDESEDYAFGSIPLVLWGPAELCAINVAACIPTLRPLYLWMAGRDVDGSTLRTGGNTAGTARLDDPHHTATSDSQGNIYHLQSYNVSSKRGDDERGDDEQNLFATKTYVNGGSREIMPPKREQRMY